MNYIITGGTGFIGTHLTNWLKELNLSAQVYNLDIVRPGTPNPVVKNYKPIVKKEQAALAGAMGAPMGICPARVRKLQISTNISGKKLKACGYPFHWTFEEALADWWADNDHAGLE